MKNKILGGALGIEKLKGKEGIEAFLGYLDGIFKDGFVELFEAYWGVKRFKRETYMEFKSRIMKAEKLGMKYPEVIQSLIASKLRSKSSYLMWSIKRIQRIF